MKSKRDEVIGERKRNLELRIKEMSGHITADQKEQIMRQFMLELNNLEKAIAIERDTQLKKMRQRLIKKKVEQERFKKEEEQQKRVDELKRQIGKYLLQAIKQARVKNMQAKAAMVIKQVISKPGSSAGKRIMPFKVVDKVEEIMGTKDLRLLLQQWKDRVLEQQSAELGNIWERNTADAKQDSPRSSVSKMSKITGLKPPLFNQGGAHVQSQITINNNYTMEELMRRVRRIEKLTDRMSQGQFETKKIAEKVIAGAQIGSVS